MEQQKRFILAMFISAGILIAWQSFFPPPPPNPQGVLGKSEGVVKDAHDSAKGDAKSKSKTTSLVKTGDQESAKNAGVTALKKPPKKVAVRSDVIQTKDAHITFSNKGGRTTGLTLHSPAQYKKAGDLLGSIPTGSTQYPFAISFDKGNLNIPEDTVFEVVKAPESGKPASEHGDNTIVYRYTDPAGRFEVDKTFTVLDKHPHALELIVSVKNLSNAAITDRFMLDITGHKDPKIEKSFLDFQPAELEGICRLKSDTERVMFASIKDEAELFKEEPITWAAIGTRYFLRAVVPTVAAESCEIKKVDKDYLRMRMSWDVFTVKPKETHEYKHMIYLGPKDLDVLGSIGFDLAESVDYGILTILAKPMRWLLNQFYGFVGNWGVAILLLTLLIKLATWKFTEKSYANAERMKEIQPLLDKIRSKYENDQQRLAEETMKLFKEHKFNPMGGCLPMVLQMPILYALYVMIINSVELYQAEFFLWYTDLSSSDPYFVLPVLMGITMLIQQYFMTPSSQNQQTKVMMQLMPIIFTSFMLFLPSGLVLYYFLNLVLGVLQQYLIRRKFAKKAKVKAA